LKEVKAESVANGLNIYKTFKLPEQRGEVEAQAQIQNTDLSKSHL